MLISAYVAVRLVKIKSLTAHLC